MGTGACRELAAVPEFLLSLSLLPRPHRHRSIVRSKHFQYHMFLDFGHGLLAPSATQTELLGGFNSEAMKGVSIMKVEDMVKVAIEGMQTDRFEIRPGQANQLKMMSRVAPGFILKQMSRSVDRMLRTQNKPEVCE